MRAFLERLSPRDGSAFFCRERRDKAFSFAWHYHPEYELTFIARSAGRRFVGDHVEDYGPGDLVLLGPNLPHSWASRAGSRGEHVAIVAQFALESLGRGVADALGRGPVARLFARSARGLAFAPATAAALSARLCALPRQTGLRQLGELFLVLDELAGARDARELATHAMTSDFQRAATHPIDPVIRFMTARFRGPVSLAEAAAIAGLSVSAFCRFFKRTMGRSFVDHLNELRVAEACRLLVESPRRVADVALDAGFSNLSHFNQCFRQRKGMRPSEYRRAFRPPPTRPSPARRPGGT